MNDWLIKNFKVDPSYATFIEFFIAILVVLALIAVFVWVLRRVTGSRFTGGRNRQPRLSIMDATAIDQRRRIILIRRDNVEHLILVGGPTDVVVEQNIVRGVPVSASYPRPGANAEPAMEQKLPAMTAPQAPAAPLQSPPMQVSPGPAQQTAAATPRPTPPQQTPVQRPRPTPPQGQAPATPQAGQPPAAQRPRQAPPPPPPAGTHAQSVLQQTPGSQATADDQPQRRAGAAVAAAGAAVANLARETIARVPTPTRAPVAERQPDRPQEPLPRRTITPPSSGPAANAKSLYLQPQEDETKAESVPSAPAVPPVAPVGNPLAQATGQKTEQKPASERATVPPTILGLEDSLEQDLLGTLSDQARDPSAFKAAAAFVSPQIPTPPAAAAASHPAQASQPVEVHAPQKPMPAAAPAPVMAPTTVAPKFETQDDRPRHPSIAPAVETPKAPPKDVVVTQEMQPKNEKDAPAKSNAPEIVKSDTEAVEKKKETPGEPAMSAPGVKAAAPENEEAKKTAPEVKSDPQTGPITIDAIEEEMAKLLNEIGGNRSR